MTSKLRRLFRSNRRDCQHGGVAIIAVASLVLLSTVTMLVLRTGHASAVKRELQSAADAAAVALAAQLREVGLPTAPGSDGQINLTASIRNIIDQHTKLQYGVKGHLLDSVREGRATYAVVQITITAQYSSPFDVFKQGSKELIYKSRARVREMKT